MTAPATLGTSWRERSLEDSIVLAEAAKGFAGISRVSRIDGLAGLPFPVFSVARPLSKVAVTVHSGKGTTAAEARASGLFEAIEVACAEVRVPSCQASVGELVAQRARFVPLELLCSEAGDAAFPWSEAFDYETAEAVLVPACALSLLPVDGPYLCDTSGLASGASVHEALFHGLLELIERHNYSLALVNCSGRSLVIEDVEDPFVAELRGGLAQRALMLEVKDISEWTGVPTYYALIFSDAEEDSHLVAGGLGAHLDPFVALRRALTEALQSRAVAVAGGREDITDAQRTRGARFAQVRKLFRFWYEVSAEKAPRPKAVPPMPFREAIAAVLRSARAKDSGLGRFLHYVYPAPEGIAVVRTILEGAEVFGLDRRRLGPRIRKIYQDAKIR